jgi:dihydrofolate reductase
MIVSAIAAVAKNGVIGKGNEIPWYLPADLKYFKKTTLNRHIIMGRYSFLSIGRPLPKRVNIVVTRNLFFAASGCVVAHSVEEALDYARQQGEEEAFIIGGGQIYEQSMPLWDRLYLTEVDLEVPDGEVFFPKYDPAQWKLLSEEAHQPDEKNEHAYVFKVLERK